MSAFRRQPDSRHAAHFFLCSRSSLISPKRKVILVSVSCPNQCRRASTLVAYTIFSRSGNPTKYIRVPAVRDKNKSDAFSSSFHCPQVAYSSNWFTHPSKSPFPSYFSGLRLNFFNSILRCSSSSLPRCSAPHHGGDVAGVDALKSNLPLSFFFEEYLRVCLHACDHPRSSQHRSNTAATSVTTVPLSVCHGALNLSDASNFVPYACDRPVTRGDCEGPEVPYRNRLFPVVAWQQNGRTVLQGLSHLYFPFSGGSGRPWPFAGSMSFLFIFVPIPS